MSFAPPAARGVSFSISRCMTNSNKSPVASCTVDGLAKLGTGEGDSGTVVSSTSSTATRRFRVDAVGDSASVCAWLKNASSMVSSMMK